MREQKGEENRIITAFTRCRDALVRSVMKMSVKPEDVDDILQETFLRAYTADQRKQIRSPQDYLFVVSRNLVIRGVTHRSREINAVIDDALFEVSDRSLASELHEKLKFQALHKALETLPEKQRQTILLRKVYGLSSKEIAGKMKVSKSSVDKYIAAGIKRCEEILDAGGYEVGRESEDNVLDKTKE